MNIENIRNNIRNKLNANKQEQIDEHNKRTNKHSSKWYGNKAWHILRNQYYTAQPICECCLKQGIIKSADSVHHLKRFMSGDSEEDKWKLFLDWNNLCSLCTRHHNMCHEMMRAQGRNEMTIDEVIQYDALLNDKF